MKIDQKAQLSVFGCVTYGDLQLPAVVPGVDELRVVEDHAVHGPAHPGGRADEQRPLGDGVATLVAPLHVPQQTLGLAFGQVVLYGRCVVLAKLRGKVGVSLVKCNDEKDVIREATLFVNL